MKKSRIFRILFCISFLSVNGFPIHAQTYLDYTTFLKNNVAIAGLQFSADGKSLLYSITKLDWENNRKKTEYVVYDLATKTTQTLQFNERNPSQARWSSSGKYFSYVAIPDSTGASTPQIHIKEEATGKVERVTSSTSGIVSYAWSPNEKMILYVASDIAPPKTGDQKFVRAFEVGNNSYTTTSQPLSNQLYLININGSPAKQLTNGNGSAGEPGWLNDTTIIYEKYISAYTGDWRNSQIVMYDIRNNKMQPLASGFNPEGNAGVSPDNTMIAFSHPRNNIPANLSDITVVDLSNKKKWNLTDKLDRSISGYEWAKDGKALIAAIANKSKIELVAIGIDKKINWFPLTDVTGVGEFEVNRSTGQVAFTGSTMNSTADLYLYESAGRQLEKISTYNKYLENYSFGKTEAIEWPVSGGMIADGIVTYPPDFDKSKKYPLVLYIHGGPTAASFVSFSPFVQQMASQSWIVFQPNYRGSLNRGNQFQGAIANDAGFGPGEDIIKGVAALKQKGNIDDKNIAVTGWSYGGFMTAWLIGKYPSMWKAAVAGAAPIDITDATSLTDNNVAIRHAFTSSPWIGNNLKKYYDMSPIMNLPKVKTPTLVMSVVGDERVPITGSYKIYHALKANNVPVKFIAYPGNTHFPTDPANQNDVYSRWIAWLKKYLD